MKKFFICLIILATFFNVLLCSSCKSDDNPTSSYILLNDFESYEDIRKNDHQCYSSDSTPLFGNVTINKDEQYITSGKGSMKYEVTDTTFYTDHKSRTSSFLIPTEKGGVSYKDFTTVKSVIIDIFNEGDNDLKLDCYLADVVGTAHGSQQQIAYPSQTFTLKKGLNNIVYNIDRLTMSFMLDLENVNYIGFRITGVDGVVYLDNMRIAKSQVSFKEFDFSLDKGEVCSFDKDYQAVVAFPYENSVVNLITELNTDRKNSAKGNSLKVTIPGNQNVGNVKVKFSSKLIKKANLTSYSENAKFVFDVRKEYDWAQWLVVVFRDTSKNNAYKNYSTGVDKGTEWQTIEIPLSEVRDSAPSPDALEIYFPSVGTNELVLYFDNFRVID